MCKIRYLCKSVIVHILKMLKPLKSILKVKLCHLLWLLCIVLCFFVLWIFSGDEYCEKHSGHVVFPVILWWTMEFPGSSLIRHCSDNIKCYIYSDVKTVEHNNVDAYLFYASNIKFDDLPLPRKPNDIIWGLYHEESPRNVEELLHEQLLTLFNFLSTFSRFSDVPFPLQYLQSFEDIISTKYYVETPVKNQYLDEIAPVMYLQSDCETSTERDAYVTELMKHIKIDSYGKCLNNKELPNKFTIDYLNNLDKDEFLRFIARYKFVIAIENGVCNDYVTEKYWRAIKVGSVPIYFGSPLIKDWYPNEKSAILLQDFPTPKLLSEHLKQLLNNDTMYSEYLEHKTKRIITNKFLLNEYNSRKYQLDSLQTVEKFECFVCKKLHERLKGDNSVNVMTKSHYDCPKPISALTLDVNPENSWVFSWESAEINAKKIYNEIMKRN